jgi:hypothetical protein
MKISARAALAFYLAAMFATLPILPVIVTGVQDQVGESAVSAPLYALLAVCLLLPLLRLARSPRPPLPWPHLSYLLLLLGALVALRTLVSSPIGRVHLVEYGLLAILVLRALPAGVGRYPAAFASAAAVGLLDETVQHFLPNRVFDWYDVGLNAAAALLGLLAAAWWTWTGAAAAAERPEVSPGSE